MQTMGYFPLGVTTVLATAKDGSDNTATCTFDMNVTESTGELAESLLGFLKLLAFFERVNV